MKTYFTFEPKYFNNNGDQGNIEVLRFCLKQKQIEFQSTSEPATSDFLLVGDAAIAVMEHFSNQLDELRDVIAHRFLEGRPTLLVGSAYEYFAKELGLNPERVNRRSAFEMTPEGYFGYRNSDSSLPICITRGDFIATSLFGPFLAKNPAVLGRLLLSLGAKLELDARVMKWIEAIRQQGA